jgi:hypothetical protein
MLSVAVMESCCRWKEEVASDGDGDHHHLERRLSVVV